MSLGKKKMLHQAADSGLANTDNFAPVLYTGNSTNDQSITGVGFQPDFVWIKSRNTGTGTSYHGLWDSVRGTGGHLYSSLTNAETNTPNRLYSFDSDGFSLGNGSDAEYIGNSNYVAWCWKAGGAAVSNTDGSITSSVSANPDAGFSIVKWSADGSTNGQVGHGLSSTPELVITKSLSSSGWWTLTTVIDGSLDYLRLDTTDAKVNTSGLTISSTTITNWGYASEDVISYCFHSVDGYQKVGSYAGNGGTQSITLGFSPRFVMWKATNNAENWYMMDSVRGENIVLYADGSFAEGTSLGVSFTSTGFTLTNSFNASSRNYIYLAIA